MKYPLIKRLEVIQAYIKGEVSKASSATLLSCSIRTIERQVKAFIVFGPDGLKDNRHSNYYKISEKERSLVVTLKKVDRWRLARNIRDKLNFLLTEKQSITFLESRVFPGKTTKESRHSFVLKQNLPMIFGKLT